MNKPENLYLRFNGSKGSMALVFKTAPAAQYMSEQVLSLGQSITATVRNKIQVLHQKTYNYAYEFSIAKRAVIKDMQSDNV